MSDEFDLLISNASIVDGTGAQRYTGSIALKGDRIAAVGEIQGKQRLEARKVLDVGGLTATPGFIDVHNHGDLSILHYPEAQGFLRQGITTFVGGNCGSSPGPYGDYIGQPWFYYDLYNEVAPYMYYWDWLLPRDQFNEKHRDLYGWEIDWSTLAEFFQRVETNELSPNYVPILGHGEVRSLVMGPDFKRTATNKEVKLMREHVTSAMEEGCRGISVGRDYDPGIYADLQEILECAKAAAKFGGVYCSHSLRTGHRKARQPGEFPPAKIDGVLEAIEIGRKAMMPVQISHLGSLYDVWPSGSEVMTEASVRATLKIIDDARVDGVNVNFDLIPHHLSGGIYTTPWLVALLAPWLRSAGSLEQLAWNLAMKEFRQEVKEAIMSGKHYGLNPNINPNWAKERTIVECREDHFKDKTVAEVAEMLGVNPLDALMDVLMADPETKATRMGDDDWAKLLFYLHPEMMIGIDTFAVDDKWRCVHPPWFLPNENSYGGFPRYFRRAYRETGTLNLEEAVRKVTSLPASKFNLPERGVLKTGAFADIVVMNPETVTDLGDQLNPQRYPQGVEHVIVNGTLVVENSKHTGARPGRILRRI